MFKTDFFANDPASLEQWRRLTAAVMDTLERNLPAGAYAGGDARDLGAVIEPEMLPAGARSLDQAMEALGRIVRHSVAVWHPHTAAHLHCPVLLPGVAAETVVGALNQSMDSFDQAAAATLLEQRMAEWLCRLAGLPQEAGATFTSGGTQSNYMGLLLARDAFSQRHWGHATRRSGLHPEFRRLRILCSRFAHFSVAKSAIQLGLGEDAVVPVDADDNYRTNPEALEAAIARVRAEGNLPFAIVTTAGTTDFGAIPPLDRIADIAAREGLWLHVDAAYGGALLLSPTHRAKLAGIGRADSISVDFHKAFYQPISCSAFLLADRRHFELVRINAEYLNPEDHDAEGFPDLVNWSISTTRRFDSLKLWLTFQLVGAERFAAMIDRTVELAGWFAGHLAGDARFEPLHRPDYGCVVFRYVSGGGAVLDEALNDAIPKALFRAGEAVLGHTRIDGRNCLKVTLLNPRTEPADLLALLDRIEACGRRLSSD